ncbi:TetR/AcrR family transcriptional regulator [Rugosimonospora africana]|nr:TetR/AcrR family transcriptional regulator [Rugosimonospora africana]
MTTATPAASADQDRKSPGRPRSARVEEAIIESILDMLAEGTPFDGLSVEAVAARAGVGKATIYRRWPNKEALLYDAVARVKGEPAQTTGTSVREDILALLVPVGRPETTRAGQIMPCLYVEMQRSPELREVYRRITEPRRESMRAVLNRGIAEGTLRPGLDIDTILAMLFGPLIARSLVNWDPAISREDAARRLVDAIWPAIAVDPHAESA